ncbi:hypothetical protein [Acinetobacter sp. B51(2017)]|uniref:hypothetical protein n=1 Tax=Acinetobacter sp. B51(2017) TaxID=2060938 RepID=UPI000F08F2B7|nr:hypothetical protein [Acinetobacter sp. B51(2017)]
MAFDLVQYFAEQISIQKPQLLEQYDHTTRQNLLHDLNVLSLGKLIVLWREDHNKLYQEIQSQEHLYIQEIARRLTTSVHNQSPLPKEQLEPALTDIVSLQLQELKQLDDTASFGVEGFRELFRGQVEHLSGQAHDWVWLTNRLIELQGSKPIVQEPLSLQTTLKEFNQMVSQNDHHDHHPVAEVAVPAVPAWSKVLEPVVAIVILWILYSAVTQVFA